MTSVLAFAFLAAVSSAAPAADEVTSLPGWNGTLFSKMYSGFISPQESHHIHYYFVESESDPSSDPIVLWVQGGPGGSSLEGAFTENMGPFQLYDASLQTTPPTLFRSNSPWTSKFNMLFWEAPAGVGFSYCDGAAGGCPAWNDTTSATEQASFICKWFEAFPEFAGNDFFIAGESYAGVYIPTTAHELLVNGCGAGVEVNLKGVAIGNGCTGTDAGTCSPQRAVNTFEELAAQGFLSQATAGAVRVECADSDGFTRASPACQAAVLEASAEAGNFNNYNVHDTCGPPADGSTLASFVCGETPGADWACDFDGAGSRTGVGVPHSQRRDSFEGPRAAMYGYGGSTDPKTNEAMAKVAAKAKAKAEAAKGAAMASPSALTVGADGASLYPETYPCNTDWPDALATWLSEAAVMDALHVTAAGMEYWPGDGIDYTRTAADLISPDAANGYVDLIGRTRVLIYSGDFDGQVPHYGTEQWTRGLGYGLAEGCAGWRPWTLDNGQTAGHFVKYNVPTEFTYMTVARAGHMAPTYRPAESLAMIQRFVAGQGY